MPECENPLVPCAMTGAVACLAGFSGITVVIHGSSGCYYYPATLLRAPLAGTFIVEQDIIFGSETRLIEVVRELAGSGKRIAVVTSCVPAILGEDIRAILSSYEVILVDSPGFSGPFETGYKKALSVLSPKIDPEREGVNIDGVSHLDPFYRGNVLELKRLLTMSGVPVATVLCSDTFTNIPVCSQYTITTDGDLVSGIGLNLGGTLGFDAVRQTFRKIANTIDGSDPESVLKEIDFEEERLVRACDKFLRRFDPPHVAIFSGNSYAAFATAALKKYLDAEIVCVGTRTDTTETSAGRCVPAPGFSDVRALIRKYSPDLVIGSSFEKSIRGDAAFAGLTPPLKDRVRLSPAPIAGITGTLSFMEEVINACIDQKSRR